MDDIGFRAICISWEHRNRSGFCAHEIRVQFVHTYQGADTSVQKSDKHPPFSPPPPQKKKCKPLFGADVSASLVLPARVLGSHWLRPVPLQVVEMMKAHTAVSTKKKSDVVQPNRNSKGL